MPEPIKLDPIPWFHPHQLCDVCGDRGPDACPKCLFRPRSGYSQNREDYE
jgi:hypothetical protein